MYKEDFALNNQQCLIWDKIQSTWAWVVVPTRVPFMNQIELFNHLLYFITFKCVQTKDSNQVELVLDSNAWKHLIVQIKLLVLDRNTWNHLTVCKQMSSGSFKNCYLQTIFY